MLTKLFTLACLCMFAVGFSRTVSAQRPYRMNDRQVDNMLRHMEQQSDRFRSSLDAALDKSRFNGSDREDDINAFVKDFYEQTKRLHNHFDDHKSTGADVQAVLERAARIEGFILRHPLTPRAQDDWSKLKANLDELAAAYEVSWSWSDKVTRYSQIVSEYPGTTNVGNGAVVPYRVNDREVEQILKRIENQSDKFRSAIDSALDKSRLDGTRREDDLNSFVKAFYEQTKALRDHFDDHKSTGADVQSVLERASRIDEFMRRNRLRRNNADKEWEKLRMNLDELARVYNVNWRWGY
jgi:predicted glycoside hydrolase/deacetylase ChbG (UPF0249 family)